MVSFIRADLEFVLQQILIAEAHAGGGDPAALLPNAQVPFGLRTVDGSFNNLVAGQDAFGAADTTFPRLTTPVFRTAEASVFGPPGGTPTSYTQTSGLVFDAQPRTISNLIVDQTMNNPAAIAAALLLAGSQDVEADTATVQAAFQAIAAAAAPEAKAQAKADFDALTAQLNLSVVTSPGLDGQFGTDDDRQVFQIDNVTPDAGLGAPFNAWMTFFGQFFDHGLDLVTKGGSGTIFIPLQPDDPLYAEGSPTNFMVLTRATNQPGPDGVVGTEDDIHEHENTTSPFVDQNQTYSSHPSHQVFLRAFDMVGGEPVATGKLITNWNLGADGHFGGSGADADSEIGGMATWAVVKAQAQDKLGILLGDYDIGNVPLLATDAYGNFIKGPNGFPQVVVAVAETIDGVTTVTQHLVEGVPGGLDIHNLAIPGDVVQQVGATYQWAVVGTGHQFLIDVAHSALPFDDAGNQLQADADGVAGGTPAPGFYDDELLDVHYMAGDGRVNENIGLTAVHAIFHSEHNRLVEHTKSVVLATGDVAFLNQWLLAPLDAFPASPEAIDALQWNGERLFQAAKFGTEMQYQHLVFEEFARTVQPQIDEFLAPNGYDTTIDPSIVAEFAHTVYRFGHSMLTETVDRLDANFDPVNGDPQLGLIAAFLNPLAYATSGLTPEQATGAIVRGVTRQAGNEIDEFVTEALRNNLLGLPLDLPAINIARGRDAGIPTLNASRAQFYQMTGDSQLKPYLSWADLAQHLKYPESLINFISAYGTHIAIASATTMADKRAAALLLVMGDGDDTDGIVIDGVTYTDRLDFLNSTGEWANDGALHTVKDLDGVTTTGLGNIDLWIGGLAEKQMPFGGLLGSTFNFVFETQLEALQNGDRFYYLSRTAGLHFGAELEQNSFAKLVMLNSDVTHLPDAIFSTPAFTLEVDQSKQYTGLGVDGRADPTGGITINGVEVTPLVIRDNPATPDEDSNYLRYTGLDHVVLGGTSGDDIIISSEGDDTLYGDAGNDRLEGGYGNDTIMGGDGDDIIQDMGGDDILQGGAGNDVIHAGNMEAGGLGNIILGGDGKDFILTTEDISTTFGGQGDDFIYSAKTSLPPTGNEGDDWIEWGTQDGAPGDNFAPFLADDVIGHDIFIGGGGFDEMIGEGGDDIFVGSDAQDKMDGMSGFDWVTYKNDRFGVTADLGEAIFGGVGEIGDHIALPFAASPQSILDRFAEVEGISGTAFTDILRGDNVDAVTILNHGGATGGALTNLALVDGLEALLTEAGLPTTNVPESGFVAGNIMLGGAGGDFLEGRGGDDLIDGDKWLNVRISIRDPNNPDVEWATADSMIGDITRTSEDAPAEIAGKLHMLMLNGVVNPGQLQAVREILQAADGYDTAIFSGPRINYTILVDGTVIGGDGPFDFGNGAVVQVIDNVGTDGTDTLVSVERLQFSDILVRLQGGNAAPEGTPTISDTSPTEGQLLSVSIAGVTDPDNPNGGTITSQVVYTWQVERDPGSGIFEDIINLPAGDLAFQSANGSSFRVTPDLAGLSLRVKAIYVDAQGVPEIMFSAATDPVIDVPDAPPVPPAGTGGPEPTEGGEGIRMVRADLDFILAQIRLAEQHASGADLLSLVPNVRAAAGLRTVDGSYNNLVNFGGVDQSEFGAADNVFPRVTTPVFRPADPVPPGFPGSGTPTSYQQTSGFVFDSQPRTISNLIVDQTMNNPAAIAAALLNAGSTDVAADTAAILAALQALEDAEGNQAILIAQLQQEVDDAQAALEAASAGIPALQTAADLANTIEADTQLEFGAASAASAAAFAAFQADPTQANLDALIETNQVLAVVGSDLVEATSNSNAADAALEAATTAAAGAEAILDETQAALDAAIAADPVAEAKQAFETVAHDLGLQVVASPGLDGQFGTGDDAPVLFIPNVAPDAGLSAPFNAWMTFFGQFFDHGLDLVTKGGSGTVFIPLQPDDPLYVEGSPSNFMVLTRATNLPGEDGIRGTADDIHEHENTTSPFVDQNQTYSSHPSHQVFLRAYEVGPDGKPHATGGLITNRDLGPDGKYGTVDDVEIGGMATWKVVKAQARDILGIEITDADVFNVPLLATDAYGNFIKGPNGFPQLVVGLGADGQFGTADDVLVEGNPADPVNPTEVGAFRTGHQFLIDIAHSADPTGGATADADSDIGNAVQVNPATGTNITYDNELLDAHYIAGDGRVNENIGLTAVHAIFHSEHNRLVEQTRDTALASNDLAFLNEWLLVPVEVFPATSEAISALQWNGERLFQAAKFGTEMQYQHLVFEEFARTIQPNVDLFFAPTQVYDVDLDPSIVAEFAHTVYRFGHSMLTETLDRYDANFNVIGDASNPDQQLGLIAAFLNPLAYAASGTDPEDATSAIVRGVTRQTGNEIDEFVTEALRNNLLGLPLDLATINLARGRDAGIPSLNAVRRQIYDATGDSQLKPYTSWADLVIYLKHPESLINFIAAYGKHSSITSATTLEGKRAASLALVLGGVDAPADRLDFLNGAGAWASLANGVTITGVDDIDLWIGGLAEEKMPFGGMLGSTFNFIFENQLEKLQDGDRFYYLERTAGLAFNAELESNSFAKLIMANTNATHLPGLVFSSPAFTLEVDQSKQFNAGLGNADPTGGSPLVPLVIRDNPDTAGPDSNYLRYTGPDHVVLGGTDGDDILIASEGDDTIWGDAGNDRIDGGDGNDQLRGGAGDDIITDLGGDDNIQGGDGNDVIHGGNGVNLVIGGFGSDFIITGEDASEAIGGQGNDFILGSKANEQDMGNEGDDWIEGGTSDGAPGDNFDPLGNDPIIGNDVYIGKGENDKFNGEGGDDIMVGSVGLGDRYIGASGFDWATFKNDPFGVTVDISDRFFDQPPVPGSGASVLARFDAVEGLSGSQFGDVLQGDNVDATALATAGARGSVLTNIALIDGLQELLGEGVTFFDGGNIILGGGGGDIIEGRGGNDLIDGDAWLNVRIEVTGTTDPATGKPYTFDSMEPMIPHMLSGEWNPGQLRIVREILLADDTATDTAVFSGPLANYTIDIDDRGTADTGDDIITVTDTVGADGTDTLKHIERLQFSDATVVVGGDNSEPVGELAITGDLVEGSPLTVSIADVTDADNVRPGNPDGHITGPVSYFWQAELRPGTGVYEDILTDFTAGEVARVIGPTFTPGAGEAGLNLRVRAVYRDANGVLEQVFSTPTGPIANLNDAATGAPLITDLTPTEGFALTALLTDITDPDGLTTALAADAFTFQWQSSSDQVTWTDVGDGTQLFVPTQAEVGLFLRVVVTFTDDGGTLEIVTSPATEVVGDLIFGLNTRETLTGTAGQDEIWGGGGNDLIDGLVGADFMAGEAGNDTFIVDNVGDIVFEDVGQGTDRVRATLTSYTLEANVENLTFIGAGNFTGTGNELNNTIAGNAGADTLDGEAGNDTLNGGAGNDILTGGAGNDAVNGNAGADRFTATIGDGNDTYAGGAGIDTYDLSGTTAGANITPGSASSAQTGNDVLAGFENFIGSQGNDLINVNGNANVIDGQGGDDTINAGGAADTVSGGSGNDTLNGEGGNDTLNGDDGDDRLNGGAGSDILTGGIGADIFTYNFGGGADTVDGGDGIDTLNIAGTGGANTLDVVWNGSALTQFEGGTVTGVEAINANLQGGTDTLSYAGSTANITVNLATNTAAGFASIAGIENVTGGSGNDTLTGGAGVNALNGGAGNDTLDGGAGNDTLNGGAGDDTYIANQGDTIVEAAGGGIDTVQTASASFALANNVENLTFTGAGNFTGNGNGANNVITGGGGSDALSGAGGNDTLDGGGGSDTLTGGAGDDILIGGAGNDTMNGGNGSDTFVFAAGFGNDTINQFDANPTGGQDHIDLTVLGITADTFAASVTIADLGADMLITVAGGGTITLAGVSGTGANALTQQDFILL